MSVEHQLSLIHSLTTIRLHWAALEDPPSSGRRAGRSSGIATRGVPPHDPVNDPLGVMVTDDHLETDADIDRATRIVSLRREVVDVLNAISRWVMEDRPVTKALPDGTSALSMSLFLERHAEWIAMQTDEDDYEVDRLANLAARVQNVAAPKRRDWVYLGPCPFIHWHAEQERSWHCAGRVRARIGGDGTARCSKCDQEQEIAWWEDVLGIGWAPVTLPKLPAILRDRLHMTVTERTLRNWVRDGFIAPRAEPFGPAPLHARYDPHAVLTQVLRLGRTCVMCGQPWSGYADTCLRCYVTMPSQPQRARRKPLPPGPRRITQPRIVPDSHELDRPERCHWSDLPKDQCACGRHSEVS